MVRQKLIKKQTGTVQLALGGSIALCPHTPGACINEGMMATLAGSWNGSSDLS